MVKIPNVWIMLRKKVRLKLSKAIKDGHQNRLEQWLAEKSACNRSYDRLDPLHSCPINKYLTRAPNFNAIRNHRFYNGVKKFHLCWNILKMLIQTIMPKHGKRQILLTKLVLGSKSHVESRVCVSSLIWFLLIKSKERVRWVQTKNGIHVSIYSICTHEEKSQSRTSFFLFFLIS